MKRDTVRVGLTVLKCKPQENRQPPPAGWCDPNLTNTTYGHYTEDGCIAQCVDDTLMTACSCVPIQPPQPGNSDKVYTPCTIERWATYVKYQYYCKWLGEWLSNSLKSCVI